jgi:hypothetical protein
MAAYGFLEGHPAFWKRPRPEEYPNEWSTDEGVSTIWSCPSYRKDGSIVMMMETGSMVPPERKHRYHDLRLDTYEDTYEKGIIATAKKLPMIEFEKNLQMIPELEKIFK